MIDLQQINNATDLANRLADVVGDIVDVMFTDDDVRLDRWLELADALYNFHQADGLS